MHPLSWFTDRAGSVVIRNGKEFKIKNEDYAQHCFELQNEGLRFFDPKPQVTVTSAPHAVCTACEG